MNDSVGDEFGMQNDKWDEASLVCNYNKYQGRMTQTLLQKNQIKIVTRQQ